MWQSCRKPWPCSLSFHEPLRALSLCSANSTYRKKRRPQDALMDKPATFGIMLQRHVLFLLLPLAFFGVSLFAQTVRHPRPEILLVQLNESSTQIEVYRRSKQQEALANVLEDDRQINRSLIADFKAHFSFCPVYFFEQKDAEAVRQQRWEQVTLYDVDYLDSPRKIEWKTPGLYYIAVLGYPPIQRFDTLNTHATLGRHEILKGGDDYVATRDYCLLLYNHEMQLLKGKLGVTNISLRKAGSLFRPEQRQFRFSGAQALQHALDKFTLH